MPLTSSLYVPGTLSPTAPLLVDVGTGFFIEKNGAEAIDFYNRKVEELGGNLKELEAVIQVKGRTVRIVEDGELALSGLRASLVGLVRCGTLC